MFIGRKRKKKNKEVNREGGRCKISLPEGSTYTQRESGDCLYVCSCNSKFSTQSSLLKHSDQRCPLRKAPSQDEIFPAAEKKTFSMFEDRETADFLKCKSSLFSST